MLSIPVMEQALDLAKQKAGGNVGLGRVLGITPQAVSQWRRAPANRVIEIERATGVPRTDLRPDIYPPAAMEAAE